MPSSPIRDDAGLDWATAETQFNRALELNPNSAPIHEKYALLGPHSQLSKALQKSSVASTSTRLLAFLPCRGFICYFARHYDDALSLIQRVPRSISIPRIELSSRRRLCGAGKILRIHSRVPKIRCRSGFFGPPGNTYARRTYRRRSQNDRPARTARTEEWCWRTRLPSCMPTRQQAASLQMLEDAYAAHDVGSYI